MNAEIETVKGFRDYLPPESLKRAAIRRTTESLFQRYGFLPLETPVIEYDELMRSEVLPNEQEDEAVADRFRLKDRGGRNLGLRYEFTFQLARIFKQNPNMKLPFRRYQIGENFRDEPLRAGRLRQFTQCDADIIGDPSARADAECLILISDLFKELGIKGYEIQINNRMLLNAVIESVEITATKQVLRELDKLPKIGEDLVKLNLKKYADANQIVTLFKLFQKDLSFFMKNKFDGAGELNEAQEFCRRGGVATIFVPSLVRGFSYYTGNIFEIVNEQKSTLAAGGRYDKSVGKYLGRDIPAVGISFSIESIMALCAQELEKLPTPSIPTVLLISLQQDVETATLLRKIRKAGISCISLYEKTNKALEYANASQIPYVIFIGEQEIAKEKLKLRNMKTGEEKLLSEKQLLKALS